MASAEVHALRRLALADFMSGRIVSLLHRKGIARVLNSRSESISDRGGAYVQARGPRWLAQELAFWRVRHDPICRADWDTLRITSTEHTGRFRYHCQVAYRRLR